MPPIGQPPKTIYECGLLRSLESKSDKEGGAYALACSLIDVATPLLDSIISGPFMHYTLHNRDHAKKLLHLADSLLPTKALEHLSIVEHLILIYAAHVHDLGLAISMKERATILQTQDFLASLRSWAELYSSLQDTRKRLQAAQTEEEKLAIETDLFQLHEAALSNYLRPIHATTDRYRELASLLKNSSGRDDLFSYKGISFEDWLIDICVSHNLPANVLAEASGPYDERYPRDVLVGGDRLNAQFCAVVLRLTDVLDFDRERTPKILFESLGMTQRTVPGADVSLKEWEKHMAVHTLSIDPDEIVVAADSHHPVIEKTIRDFCHVIEREIRDSLAVLRRNDRETTSRYFLDLPISVRPKIRPIGYVYRDIALQLNQAAIATLLMGERLYSNRAVAIRELLQNAIDACHARDQLEKGQFVPLIGVADFNDTDGRHWIEVTDNGIGMDEHVLSEYFLKLGNSYYDSPDFKRLVSKKKEVPGERFAPIARFGIGIASVFMIADLLEVQTRSFHSLYNDNTNRLVRLERMGTLAFVTESNEGPPGTKIRLRIKRDINDRYEDFVQTISSYLRTTVIRPRYEIRANLGGDKFILQKNRNLELTESGKGSLQKIDIVGFHLHLEDHSELLSGDAVIFLCETEDGYLSHKDQSDTELRLGRGGLQTQRLFNNFLGNVIAVNGFRMSFKKMARLLGFGESRIAIALDINVIGSDVDYDVARDRIVGEGRFRVGVEFRDALLKAMREKGIFDRLHPDTKELISKVLTVSTVEYVRAKGYLRLKREELKGLVESLALQREYSSNIAERIGNIITTPKEVVDELLQELVGEGLMPRILASAEARKARAGAAVQRRQKYLETKRQRKITGNKSE